MKLAAEGHQEQEQEQEQSWISYSSHGSVNNNARYTLACV